MSVEDKLHRLVIARDNIRTALEGQGIDASNHGFEGFAEDIGDIEKLSDVDVVAFGDNPTLPDKGKTNPANYEAIADAINAAKVRPNAVTVEPLSVTQNGTYQETGKAFSLVTVAVPGITKLTATYTAATDVVDTVLFPLPSSNLPKLIFIKSDTPATVLSDYAFGEIIQIIALPVSDDEISVSNSCNCAGNYRNKATGSMSKNAFVQIIAGAATANTDYYIDLENRILKFKNGNNFLAPAGVTYNIECYYWGDDA